VDEICELFPENASLKLSERIYWIKAASAIVVGLLCTAIQHYVGLDGAIVFTIGSIVYIVFSEVLAMVLKFDRNRAVRVGIGAFIFLWMLTWTLFHTILLTG